MSGFNWALIIALIIYLTPSIVALAKRNRRTKVILFNIFLGWTVVMWIISLVWACKREEPEELEQPVYYQPPQPTYYQPPQPTYQQPQPTYQQPQPTYQQPQAPQAPQQPQQPPQPPYQG